MDRENLICRCFKVTEGAIKDAIKNGATNFEEVQEKTRCSTGCGCCKADVIDIIEEELKN